MRVTLDELRSVAEVGGKAASLMRLRAAELPVPEGYALTTAFFEPWFAQLRALDAWDQLPDEPACRALQRAARELELTEGQAAVLSVAEGLWAVRSSSPEEDLEGSSFAGGYHTELGITEATLADAVRACFASALDIRVMAYKAQHGLDPRSPRIAVVVQRQIDAEVAGVAFSVNPATNDYDECAIDAAPGLGESVVSGAVTPDHFVVDTARDVVTATPASQSHALRLGPDGGTVRVAVDQPDQLCLDEARAREIAALTRRVEALFALPVDIEWAVADDALILLQARPITAWVPLPDSMKTAPGERRRLYMDIGLSGGLTINAPISPLGESWFERFGLHLIHLYLGELPWDLDDDERLVFLDGGRMYEDLSNVMWLMSPALLGRSQESLDTLVADILRAVDAQRYRKQGRPKWLSPWWLVAYPRAVWRVRRMLGRVLWSLLRPEAAKARFDEDVARYRQQMRDLEPAPPEVLVERHVPGVIRHVIEVTMPGLAVSMLGSALIAIALPRRLAAEADALARGYEGNEVVEMGQALHGLNAHLGELSPEEAGAALKSGTAPDALQQAWQHFVDHYGWRGPREMDLSSPRYADDPAMALRQVAHSEGFDPAAAIGRSRQGRLEAYERVCTEVGPLRRALVRWGYRLGECFGGARDTPKHDYLMLFAALRRSVWAHAEALVQAGRLDEADQVAGLRFEDLDRQEVDLRALAEERSRFWNLSKRVVKGYPAVIDSRGRIQRPAPREEAPGELRGMAVSTGVVRGPVRVLHRPEDGPLVPGEVLVAHTTDPGWTPLFVNAGAVVLEVGGVLQHGAVVAREYGKPCVSGILDATARLKDGELVEVDGTAGVVRRVDSLEG